MSKLPLVYLQQMQQLIDFNCNQDIAPTNTNVCSWLLINLLLGNWLLCFCVVRAGFSC